MIAPSKVLSKRPEPLFGEFTVGSISGGSKEIHKRGRQFWDFLLSWGGGLAHTSRQVSLYLRIWNLIFKKGGRAPAAPLYRSATVQFEIFGCRERYGKFTQNFTDPLLFIFIYFVYQIKFFLSPLLSFLTIPTLKFSTPYVFGVVDPHATSIFLLKDVLFKLSKIFLQFMVLLKHFMYIYNFTLV